MRRVSTQIRIRYLQVQKLMKQPGMMDTTGKKLTWPLTFLLWPLPEFRLAQNNLNPQHVNCIKPGTERKKPPTLTTTFVS